ncbi:MAG: 50S ribosomal protein L17 [Bacteroidota bacterium]
MRHRRRGRKLKRTASHRRATLAALSTSLLRHKRITTTLAKAKETRTVVERMITRARKATAQPDAPAVGVHHRRMVARMVKDKAVVKELFSSIAETVGDRPGGYTRIVKLGQREGDGAEMAVIELVDFNTGRETAEKSTPEKKKAADSAKKKTAKKATQKKETKAPEPADEEKKSKKKAGKTKEKSKKESKSKDSES